MHERHQKKKKKQEIENEKEIRFLYAKSELTELYPVFDALSFFFFFLYFLILHGAFLAFGVHKPPSSVVTCLDY